MNGFANLNIVLLFQDAPNAIKVLGSLVFVLLTSAGIGHPDYDFFLSNIDDGDHFLVT